MAFLRRSAFSARSLRQASAFFSMAMASASVHGAEVFTTAASAGSHVWHKNVDWRLLTPLALAGVIGGCLGASGSVVVWPPGTDVVEAAR